MLIKRENSPFSITCNKSCDILMLYDSCSDVVAFHSAISLRKGTQSTSVSRVAVRDVHVSSCPASLSDLRCYIQHI